MKFRPRVLLPLSVSVIVAVSALALQANKADKQERLQRHRNLGKALYESLNSAPAAVAEFRNAVKLAPESLRDRLNLGLALLRAEQTDEGIQHLLHVQKADPAIPHTWFNLGITFRKRGAIADAIRQLEQFITLVPDDPIARHNLGLLYDREGRSADAMRSFHAAARLDDRLVAPLFQIYTQHRLAGRQAEARQAALAFQQAKQAQERFGETEDTQWNEYAEIYEIIEPAAREVQAQLRLDDVTLPERVEPAGAGLLVLDSDADGRADLLAWSRRGARLYRNGSAPVASSGLETLTGITALSAGDFDNDGLIDICLATTSGIHLYRNNGGRFQPTSSQLPAGEFHQVLWFDYDHDNDSDLLVFGKSNALLRNNSDGTWTDRTADFPFVSAQPLSAALIRTMSDTLGLDVVVSYADHPTVLYRDRLRGRFEVRQVDAIPAGTEALVAWDGNNDGWMDVAFAHPKASGVALNRRGLLRAPQETASRAAAIVPVDLGNSGAQDLVVNGALLRNHGSPGFRETAALPLLKSAVAWASADFNGDNKPDLAKIANDGGVHLLLNKTTGTGKWIGVSVTGVKAAKLAQGSEVEIRAGSLYQKRVYEGTPLLFGLASRVEVDAVRITWPHGMIQNEMRQPAGRAFQYKEAPRLSGSCPMVFTWNGRAFQFITDVLGVAPLGASSGDDVFPADHDEYIQIPEGALAPNGEGMLDVRITEELREVAYLDQVQLIAVDHPAGTDIFTNDKFQSPPFPSFRLWGIRNRAYPLKATDHRGEDVLPLLRHRDRTYPSDFQRDHAGVAEMHTLDLDFGDAARGNRAALVLHGWTDWADGSTFRSASQRKSGGLRMPYLQVKDSAARWQTVLPEMGIPAGKPKTIVIDLTGKFLSASREIRIVTNLCVYWDEIFLTEDTDPPNVLLTPLDAHAATLDFRGFSRPSIHPERKQPEAFDYATVSPRSQWRRIPGLYTRYGDIRPLLERVDDRMVIMGSGDEVKLSFLASSLPPLKTGWKRDFLLMVDGWAKDGDPNTVFGDSVEPLPFHSMTRYPDEQHPQK